jgi:hypothetical protein
MANRRSFAGCLGFALLAAMAVAALPSGAAAQGLWSLFDGLGLSRSEVGAPVALTRPIEPEVAPLSYADPGTARPPAIGSLSGTGMLAPLGASAEPTPTTFCVRLCDGRYFPIDGDDAGKACSALCPASRTKIFLGASIDVAAAADGGAYARLPNAFRYRKELVPACTCNGKSPLGLAHIPVAADSTLRAGDIVATAHGLKVFQGAPAARHRSADFTPVRRSALVPDDVRRKLRGLRVAKQ